MSCCASTSECCNASPASKPVGKVVNETYSAIASKAGEDPQYAQTVAGAFGYTVDELEAIPAESNLGLSCGNPTATAKLKEGERVLDLGSGGGIDVFLAASKVGPTGQAIGLDGSAEMVALARRNASKQGLKPPQVAFVQASLEKELPIESNAIDCVLSNCVINLLPLEGKASIFKEIYRVLKPGGRVVLDDIIAKKPFPEDIKHNVAAYVGCIAGAITEGEYRKLMTDAGFQDVLFIDRKSDLNVYWTSLSVENRSSCCGSTTSESTLPPLPPGFNPNDWAASYHIYAIKPTSREEVSIPATALLRWWDAYPIVKSTPPSLTAEEVAALIRNPDKSEKEFAVIDVRRNDHAGGHVKGSKQWSAQTFFDDLPGFFENYKDTEKVIFYCQSSNGRGPRCAAWYQDYLDEQSPESHKSKAYVLQGGVKGWKAKFGGESDLLEYDP